MNGIVINIDPVALRIAHFELRWYSIFVVLAIVAAVLITLRESKRKGIPTEEIISLVPWVLIGGIVGARLFHVIDRWDFYAGHPLHIFSLQQGGLAIWGALAGGGIAVVVYALVKRISFGRLADAITPGLLVAQMIGRLACTVNGDAYGGVTSLPWGFIYIHPGAMIPDNLRGVPTHPYPVYEMLWNGLILLYVMKHRSFFSKDGLLFLTYIAYYGLGRLLLTFVRQEKIWFWGLQEAQVVAIALIVASVALFIFLSRRSGRKATSEGTA